MTDSESALAARIAAIKQEFLSQLKQEGVPALRALHARFQADPADAEARSELRRVTHDLTGSGAVFGYEEITTVGRMLEMALRSLLAQDGPLSPERHREITAMIEQLIAICAETEQDIDPPAGKTAP